MTRQGVTSFCAGFLASLSPLLLHGQTGGAPGIRSGDWTYTAQAQLGDQRQEIGLRTVSVRSSGSAGAGTWLVVMTMQVGGEPLIDSVTMNQGDLHPLSRHAIAPGTDIVLAVDDSAMHGLLTAGSTMMPLNVQLGPRSFLNYYSMRASFAELPLRSGWTGQASVLELGGEPRFATLTFTVVGEERIVGPTGSTDCWHVTVVGPGVDEHYWIDKQRQDIVRTREPIGSQGAIMQLDLKSYVPAS